MKVKLAEKVKVPRVVLLDIETSPITGYTWSTYDTNVLKVLESSKIISVAWKDLYDTKVHCKALPDYSGYRPGVIDDRKLVSEIWKVLDEADILIAHYGDGFDFKKLSARFAYYDLNAPSAYKTIDTKKVAKKYFLFDNNKLDSLGSYFKLGNKLPTGGFDTWVRCIAGDKSAWDVMKKYNIEDVILLEKVYLKLRPFMTNHPNLSLISGNRSHDHECPTCQSNKVSKRGFSLTLTGRKQRYQCNECSSWSLGSFEKVASKND